MRWLWRPKPPKQHTWVYCPNCKNELVSDPRTTYTDEEFVTYTCGECGEVSMWDFDLPAPIRVDSTWRRIDDAGEQHVDDA